MSDHYKSNGSMDGSVKQEEVSDSEQDNNSTADTMEMGKPMSPPSPEKPRDIIKPAGEYVRELLSEKLALKPNKQPHTARLIDEEIAKVQSIGKITRDNKYIDIYREKPHKVTVKVLIPVREHPRFNFVGKLLGPKGSSMKRLQEETLCKMAILGRGSMRDREQEEELRNSLDPKYGHLSDDLHIEISTIAQAAEGHARIAHALTEVRKLLVPDHVINSSDSARHHHHNDPAQTSSSSSSSHHHHHHHYRDEYEEASSPHHLAPPPKISRRHVGAGPRSPPPPPPTMRTATRVPVVPSSKSKLYLDDGYTVYSERVYDSQDDPYYESSSSRSRAHPYGGHRSDSAHYDKYDSYYMETEYYSKSGGGGSTSADLESSHRWKRHRSPSPVSRRSESSRYRSSPYSRSPK